MIKTLLGQVKEFKLVSLLTPLGMLSEVIVENFIPLQMAVIIDSIGKNDLSTIYKTSVIMLLLALAGLIAGYMGGVWGAKASTGFARNLRKAMYENIQTFSFSNIDKFSTAGLVTRLTTDVTNIQNAYQMILRMCVRAPFSLLVAMIMAFSVSPRVASVYLIAVIILGIVLAIITLNAHKYFTQVFKKYDKLNESVQENVSAMRVVKAYVREDYERGKFGKASYNIYKMFIKADWKLDEFYTAIIADELNVKEVEYTDDVRAFTSYSFKPQMKTLGPKYGKLLNAIRTALTEVDGNATMDKLNESGSFELNVEGQTIELSKDDVLIEMTQKEGFVASSDKGITVVLDTNLTPELIEEGFVREVISKVQTMRKDAGFEVMDKINLYVSGNDKIADIVNRNAAQVKTVVLAQDIITGKTAGFEKEWDINGEKVTLAVEKLA